jgi:hypothetical protein
LIDFVLLLTTVVSCVPSTDSFNQNVTGFCSLHTAPMLVLTCQTG